ncbi:MAG: carbonic anhydrase [Bacteroidota bacterium]
MSTTVISADDALKELMDGNRRFMEEHQKHPHEDRQWRYSLTEGQHPFAVILTCSDSRVAPEIIFDQGLGDLFVIRVAGNVAREKVIGSIEYAIAHLGTKLIVVMGHEKCGAVGASLEIDENEGHIGAIIQAIKPAVYLAKQMEGDLLTNSIRNNAQMVAEQLKEAQPILTREIKSGGVKVVPAYYKISTGEVELL